MGPLIRLIRPAWRGLAGSVALATLATGSGVALLAVSAWLITRAAGMPVVLTLMVAIVGVRTFGIGRAVFRYSERLVAHDAALRALVEVRVRLYAALERLAPARFWGTGDLLQRLSADVDAVADLLIRGWVPLVSSGLVLALAVCFLWLLLPAVGLTVLVAALVCAAVAALAAVRGAGAEAALAEVQAARVSVVTETIQAVADPAVLLSTGWRDRLDAIDAAEERLDARLGRWSGVTSGAAVGVFGVAVAVCWVWARAAEVPGETLAILVLLPLALTDVMTGLPGTLSQLQRGRLAAGRLLEVIDSAPADGRQQSAADDPSGLAPAGIVSVALRDVTVQWPGRDTPAISGVDLDLSPGRRIAIVGPSGSGKSTLLSALLGFAPISAGQVLLSGRVDPESDRRSAMSLCDQQAYLFDSSIVENVRLARAGATDDEVRAALASARLTDWIDALPDALHTRVGHLGGMISGGQRQRIAFARALLADRPILLLDEPTASLDQPTGRALIREMLAVGPEVCVVLVTHELDQLSGFDQVLELSARAVTVVGETT